jgi:hypothetical protein
VVIHAGVTEVGLGFAGARSGLAIRAVVVGFDGFSAVGGNQGAHGAEVVLGVEERHIPARPVLAAVEVVLDPGLAR